MGSRHGQPRRPELVRHTQSRMGVGRLMPFIRTQDRPAAVRAETLSHRLIRVYHALISTYGRLRAREKVHRSVEAERNREWTNEHARKGRR